MSISTINAVGHDDMDVIFLMSVVLQWSDITTVHVCTDSTHRITLTGDDKWMVPILEELKSYKGGTLILP